MLITWPIFTLTLTLSLKGEGGGFFKRGCAPLKLPLLKVKWEN
jgi:hypothetical protein